MDKLRTALLRNKAIWLVPLALAVLLVLLLLFLKQGGDSQPHVYQPF